MARLVELLVSLGAVSINGWQIRLTEEGRPCPRCGELGLPLYQGQRYTPGGWSDLPDALLCDRCLQRRLDVQRVEQSEPRPRRWWQWW